MFSIATSAPRSRQPPKSWMVSGWTTMGQPKGTIAARASTICFSSAAS
jgi:hypothetical protein